MHTLRICVKGLAVFVGLFGASLAVGSLMLLSYFAFGALPPSVTHADKSLVTGYLGLVALFGGLGYYFLRTAWKHLRRPDRASADSVVALAAVSLGFVLFKLVGQWPLSLEIEGIWRTRLQGLGGLTLVFALLLFYRLVLKRLTERAYPTPVSDSQSSAHC